MVWRNDYIRPNKYSRPQMKLTAVRKLVIHYTANHGATAANHKNYFNNLKGRYASAHIFVDKKEAVCILPLSEVAYHANDGSYRGVPELRPNANYLSIGVEMCQEKDGSFHPDMISRTEDVMVELCKRYKLDPLKDIVRHYDITKKNCPAPWVSNSSQFISFKNRVNEKFKNGKATSTYKPIPAKSSQSSVAQTTTNKSKWIKVSGNWTGQTLKNGQYGEPVNQLQIKLKDKGYLKSSDVDKYFGKVTENAVRKAQSEAKIKVDGLAGKETFKILSKSINNNKNKSKILEDGYWGKETTTLLQKILKTPVDGIISNQLKNDVTLNITSGITFGKGGSTVIKALQKTIGAKVDGYLGEESIRKLQRYLGTPVDGKISKPSTMVKELQRRLNKGKL